MVKGNRIFKIGVAIFSISLLISYSINFWEPLTSFLNGVGCSLSMVGAGKHFIEVRNR